MANKEDSNKATIYNENLDVALGQRYLAYALSTITDRALPDSRDGLKPVHRRILYAMRQLKLVPAGSFRKCAKIVGEVMGNYHPHGDKAIYDSLVRMAQTFTTRYPLIEGQGNFGNIDGDNAAAQRYTEARLSEISMIMLEGLDESAVDFKDNYDGSEKEPEFLPAFFPQLLANGAYGIAVGMATSIPPHNIKEILDASIKLIQNSNIDQNDLLDIIKGPDFPTGGVLVDSKKTILENYILGKGSFRIRAKFEQEFLSRGRWQIVITEIPYGIQKSKLVEKLAELINEKKLNLLSDLRDESAEDIRLVLEPKSKNIPPEILMEHLFKKTDLENRFSLNMNVLQDGKMPRVLSLKDLLQNYINHGRNILIRRSNYRLKNIDARLHLIEGFLVTYLNIDRVINIIRFNEKPKSDLQEEFDLSEIQVFNNITQLCANLTGSSLSFINILGSDVQQCKVIHGLNEEQKYYVSEVPRKISVCQFCLEKPSEPLIIENISKNSLTEKHSQLEIYKDLKFYAGIPLVTSKGYAIGSLCVVDSEEKSLSQTLSLKSVITQMV